MPLALQTWHSVVETAEFLAKASRVMTDEERAQVIALLAGNPECGDIIQGTGGVRKARVRLRGRGKSGGARVIYYFHSARLPIFVLTVFAKNERDDLTQAERNAMASVVRTIKLQLEG